MNTHLGALPLEWYLPFQQAVAIYGDALVAAVLEAPPKDQLFHHTARILVGRSSVSDAFGFMPDVGALLSLMGLDCDALIHALDVSPSVAQSHVSGDAMISCSAALMMCRTYDWPLGAFFRGTQSLHPTTALHRDLGW